MEQIFTFAGQKTGQDAAVCAVPGQQPDVDKYKPFRFARALFKFALSAGAASDLILPASTLKLFTAGVGESGADAGWPGDLTDLETDAGEEGALVGNPDRWVTRAIGIYVEPASHTGGYKFSKETELYEPRAFKALACGLRMEFKQGEKGVPFDLGPALLYSLQARGRQTDGQTLGIGAYIPLESEIVSTGENTKGRLIVTLETKAAITLPSDAAAATSNDLTVPVRVVLFGHKVEGQ